MYFVQGTRNGIHFTEPAMLLHMNYFNPYSQTCAFVSVL